MLMPMTSPHWPDLTGETVELLQALIRNACVNDGTVQSGEEVRSSDLLAGFLEGAGIEHETYDAAPGRRSLVARIDGSDLGAPSVCWMGHTDVVPANPAGWSRDPFGGELADGEVWGRGAVDMLNLTSSMAVAFRHLARSGFRPRGDLIYFAVADEEAGGRLGAQWMLEQHRDAVGADYVLTESGGLPRPGSDPPTVFMVAAEKGLAWRRLHVRGTPSHGSMPYGADNALIKAAEVIRRLAEYRPEVRLGEIWAETIRASGFDDDLTSMLLDPGGVDEALTRLEPKVARRLQACSHTTLSPNVVSGGQKTNTIPDLVSIDVDIRAIPGEAGPDVERHLATALGDMRDEVEVEVLFDQEASESRRDTPMWDCLTDLTRRVYPEARLVPTLTSGGTDSRFYRATGAIAYGAGLFGPETSYEHFIERFHGNDERIDVESLRLTTELWLGVAETFWDHV
jgi:acetylornithine deacetylase/succinyl-diaminopimelate desuccinylase-like protein